MSELQQLSQLIFTIYLVNIDALKKDHFNQTTFCSKSPLSWPLSLEEINTEITLQVSQLHFNYTFKQRYIKMHLDFSILLDKAHSFPCQENAD